MPAPSVLPGRISQRIDRKSRLLFHWRAADLSLDPVTKETPTFVRATGGGMTRDMNGNLGDYAQYQPRFEMSDPVTAGVFDTPGLLLEGQRTNLCLQSEALNNATWAKEQTPVVTEGAVVAGDLTLAKVEDDSATLLEGLNQTVTFTGDGTKVISVFVKRGNINSFIAQIVGLANRLDARMTFNADGTLGTPTINAGTYLGSVSLANGIYRLLFQASGVVAAETNRVNLYPTGAAGSDVGYTYIGGVQVENALYPSNYIRTTSATVVRNGDDLSYPYGFGPSPSSLSIYVKLNRPIWAEVSGSLGASPRLLQISTVTPQIQMYGNNGTRDFVAEVVSGSAVNALAAIPAGAVQEVLGQFKDLLTGPKAAIDIGSGLGAFSVAATTAPLVLGNATLSLTQPTTIDAALREMKIASGLFTMAQMREMF